MVVPFYYVVMVKEGRAMGELKNMQLVTVFTVRKRMEHILTVLENEIEEAKSKGEYLKAFGCLQALYEQLKEDFTELLELDGLYKALHEVTEFLDDTEKYIETHIAMTENELRLEYKEYLMESVKNHKDYKKLKMKVQKIIADDPSTPREILEEFVVVASDHTLTDDMAKVLVDEVFDLIFINMLTQLTQDMDGEEE